MLSLGKRLQAARKRQNITIEQASRALRIRPEFLQALENGEYAKLPPAYGYGFVGNYAQYLSLSKNEAIAMFHREYDEKNIKMYLYNFCFVKSEREIDKR